MITITSPIKDTLLYSDKVYVEYEVSQNSKFTEKVVFYVDATKYEKTELKGRFEVSSLAEGKHTIVAYLVNKYNKKIVGSETKLYFYTNDDVLQIRNKLSSILPSQIPEFIKNDYQVFVSFIEEYYKFLETSNDPKLVPFSSYEFSNVDTTQEFFLDRFRRQFVPDFPKELTYDLQTGKPLNLKTLIKRSSEFYRSKGTQNSFNFIFRILFDQDVEFYYPREHMFVVSGAVWKEKKTVKIIALNDDRPRSMIGNTIYQVNDQGNVIVSARVISCVLYKQSPYNIAELELTEIIGDFDQDSPILCDVVIDDAEEQLSYYLTLGIISVDITNGGFNYAEGDRVRLVPIEGQIAEGVGFIGKVDKPGPLGQITKIIIVNFGANYEQSLSGRYEIQVRTDNGTGFSGVATSDIFFSYEGYYTSNNGILCDRSFIQDNDYYQTHSYEIVSTLPLTAYQDVIKRTVHPAGYKLFGSQIITERMTLAPTVEDYQTDILASVSYYIGNYIAYRINGDVNLRDTVLDGNTDIDLFPTGVNMSRDIPPDSDGYFIHDSRSAPETTDIGGAYFENYANVSALIPDWDQRYLYWVVFPHPSVLINNTNGSIEQFFDLQIQDLAVAD
jgi:hypothetical protein